MAANCDPKVVTAEIGRSGLLRAVTGSAGANMMEREYQKSLCDLKVKQAFDDMAKEVADLPEWEKMSEVLSRFILVLVMITAPVQQPMMLWQLYTHLRSTGLLEPVKGNIGSLVDLTGRRIPSKEDPPKGVA